MMKRFLIFTICVGIGLCLLSACVDDGDNHAEAKISFQGVLTQLNYTLLSDSTAEEQNEGEAEVAKNDTLNYNDLISEAFNQLGLTGPKSVIEESAKVSEGSISYAEYVCAMQAAEKIQKKLDNTTVADIKEEVFSSHTQEMRKQGIEKPEDIPFATLSAEISYFSSNSNQPLIFKKDFL